MKFGSNIFWHYCCYTTQWLKAQRYFSLEHICRMSQTFEEFFIIFNEITRWKYWLGSWNDWTLCEVNCQVLEASQWIRIQGFEPWLLLQWIPCPPWTCWYLNRYLPLPSRHRAGASTHPAPGLLREIRDTRSWRNKFVCAKGPKGQGRLQAVALTPGQVTMSTIS